jgi:CHAT domain-containing protein
VPIDSNFPIRLLLCATVASFSSCVSRDEARRTAAAQAEVVFRNIQEIRHIQPQLALERAKQAYEDKNANYAPLIRQRLRLLYAEVLMENGKAEEVGPLLSFYPLDEETRTRLLAVIAYWEDRYDHDKAAGKIAAIALARANSIDDPCWKAEVMVRYAQALQQVGDDGTEAQIKAAESVTLSCRSDQYWTAYLYHVKSNFYIKRHRYTQELEAATAAGALANQYGFMALKALTNGTKALAYFHLGDVDQALLLWGDEEKWYPAGNHTLAIEIGHRARALRFKGEGSKAIEDYNKALTMLKPNDSWYLRNLEELTGLLIERDELSKAESYDRQAIKEADHEMESAIVSAARLNEITIARRRSDLAAALQQCKSLMDSFKQHAEDDPELNWRLHTEMAQTLEAMGRGQEADREYRIAVDTADKVRKSIDNEWSQMTFSVYLRKLVALYVDSRVKRGDDAGSLQIAETFRAQSLAEKLHSKVKPAAEHFRKIAAARDAVILSYWINGDRSYLWATTAKEIKVFRLEGMQTLDNELDDLDNDIRNHVDLLERPKPYIELYKKLVKPAEGMIGPKANVIIVPDGELARLNFELLVPDTSKQPARYWINQVSTVAVAPSLALLQNESNPPKDLQHAFLMGDPIVKDTEPELSELDYIEPLFSNPVLLTGARATAQQFIDQKPGEFAVLHISAHALGNKTSPLDSFIELTNGRLYAHDLQGLQLKEDLVTLSACQGAKGRSLPGEGVVSLTWAILSAGAHTVIATAPNVPVYTTRQFMKDFYTQLKGGDTPAKALHGTKVDLIGKQPAPYYWAGFQLYTR